MPLPDFDAGADAGGDAGFQKQGSAGRWGDPRRELSEEPYKGEGLLIRRHIGARPHMHANSSDSEYWLYEDEPGVPSAFSLMIPAESLGDAAAHDMRLVIAARPSPSTEEPVARPMGTSKKAIINFGATEFPAAAALDNTIISPPAHIAPLIGGTGVFVEPPRELHDLADVEEFHTEARTAQLFETDADSVHLSGGAQSESEGASSVYLAALVGTEILDRPSGQMMLPKPVSRYDRESYPRYATELDLDISLDDDATRVVRLISFEGPFSRDSHSRAAISNAIFLRKVGE